MFPGEFGSSLGVPSDIHNGNTSLFHSFDFSVHYFYQVFHEVKALIDFNLVKRNNRSLVGQALLQVGHMEGRMDIFLVLAVVEACMLLGQS